MSAITKSIPPERIICNASSQSHAQTTEYKPSSLAEVRILILQSSSTMRTVAIKCLLIDYKLKNTGLSCTLKI